MSLRKRIWPGAIFALLGLNFIIVAITVRLAVDDPSASVESDYYQKALSWDSTAAQRQASLELGWKVHPRLVRTEHGTQLRLTITDREGRAVHGARVDAVVYHKARASARTEVSLAEGESGEYAAPVSAEKPGLWRVDLSAHRDDQAYVQSLDCELAGSEATAGLNTAPERVP